MLLKFRFKVALAILAVSALVSCSLPWGDAPKANEVNLAFTIENNLLFLTTARINGRAGRYLLGTANSRTVLDPEFAKTLGSDPPRLQLSEKESVPFSPVLLPLEPVGDAIIGADVWTSHALTIDYKSGLAIFQKTGIEPALMNVFHYTAEPAIMINVNGTPLPAVVDTASPDTLTMPARSGDDRMKARVIIAGVDFGEVDVHLADTTQARVGNRLLSKFLVTIDYGRRQVGLWRDPRIPLH